MRRYTLVEHEDFIFPAEIRLAFDEHWQREQRSWGTLRDCLVRTADVTDLVEADLNDPELRRGHGLSFPMARAVERLT